MAAVSNKGIKFGISETTTIRKELNIQSKIQSKIRSKIQFKIQSKNQSKIKN